ncbi:uncharacterized protein LOC113467687 [Diaphorina citri]|uniref:Uncharacterized protein LOC113467687 n=1 Tax=Diaphorina citri TaxID=121845 RepID=A0A3Q0IU75_DIACI|nr:uncharacterized protein LOC113467687 [Diaphorina citri]
MLLNSTQRQYDVDTETIRRRLRGNINRRQEVKEDCSITGNPNFPTEASFRGVRGDPPPPHHHYAPSPVDLKPLPKEPEPEERTGKKHSKSAKHSGAPKGSRSTRRPEAEKPVISNPTNFEHTVHVGFDAHTGEFTVSCATRFFCFRGW